MLETQDTIEDANGNTSNVTRLAFDGYASNAQMIGLTQTDAVLQSIMKGSFKAEAELSEADLQAIRTFAVTPLGAKMCAKHSLPCPAATPA